MCPNDALLWFSMNHRGRRLQLVFHATGYFPESGFYHLGPQPCRDSKSVIPAHGEPSSNWLKRRSTTRTGITASPWRFFPWSAGKKSILCWSSALTTPRRSPTSFRRSENRLNRRRKRSYWTLWTPLGGPIKSYEQALHGLIDEQKLA